MTKDARGDELRSGRPFIDRKATYAFLWDDRRPGWRQAVFFNVARYLQRRGISLRMENRWVFQTRLLNLVHHTIPLRDSLGVLQNNVTGRYEVLDFHDWPDPPDLAWLRMDPRCRLILRCQYRQAHQGVRRHIVRPWTYFDTRWPKQPGGEMQLRSVAHSEPRLYFRGSPWDRRKPVLEALHSRGLLNPDQERVSYKQYLQEMATHHVVLSLPGFAEVCHRDIEAFALGAALLRPKLRNRFHDELIPNFHYVSVDTDLEGDPAPVVAARIEERYLSVIKTPEYLMTVARNGAAWYDRNVRASESIALTARLLGLDSDATSPTPRG